MGSERPLSRPNACLICNEIYQQAFLMSEMIPEPHTPSERVVYKRCPNCNFDPQLMIQIANIIKGKTTLTLSADKPPEINADDIVSDIAVRLKKSWPIPSKPETK